MQLELVLIYIHFNHCNRFLYFQNKSKTVREKRSRKKAFRPPFQITSKPNYFVFFFFFVVFRLYSRFINVPIYSTKLLAAELRYILYCISRNLTDSEDPICSIIVNYTRRLLNVQTSTHLNRSYLFGVCVHIQKLNYLQYIINAWRLIASGSAKLRYNIA